MRAALLAALCVLQLGVPASLVLRHEQTLASGTPWRFQAAPVDPADPYRGRYVRLGYAAEDAAVPLADAAQAYVAHGTRMYAELAAGADGFARFVRLHALRPSGVEYADVFVQGMREPGDGESPGAPAAFVRLPIDRYYLPEEAAPEVEAAYARASREARGRTYVEARVRDGHAAITALVIDGAPAP
jgi:uncharacterized membrane-anchored protein